MSASSQEQRAVVKVNRLSTGTSRGLGAIHTLVRDEPDGFTMIGEGVLDLIDPATLDAEMDAADAKERTFYEAIPEVESPWVTRKYPCRVVSYRLFDDGRRKRAPFHVVWGQWLDAFRARVLDGDTCRWCVTRMRTFR